MRYSVEKRMLVRGEIVKNASLKGQQFRSMPTGNALKNETLSVSNIPITQAKEFPLSGCEDNMHAKV